MENLRPCDQVAAWVDAHREEWGGRELKCGVQEAPARMFYAEFETPRYILWFAAWDQGSCLDIGAVSQETGNEDYLVAGPCGDREELIGRLETFLGWLRQGKTRSVEG